MDRFDIEYAKEKGWVIKTIATVQKVDDNHIALYVMPTFTKKEDDFRHINNENNAIRVEAAFSQNHFFSGKGAGGYPIGSAILSDVSAYSYHYKYAYRKKQYSNLSLSEDVELKVYMRYFDQENMDTFKFEKIEGQYSSKDYNYLIGLIKLSSLLKQRERLNTADIFMCILPE